MKIENVGDDYLKVKFEVDDDFMIFADTPSSDILRAVLCHVAELVFDKLPEGEKQDLAKGFIKESIYIAIPKI